MMSAIVLRPYRPTSERKDHGIHVRLTMGELLYIRHAAAVHGMTISGYLMGLVDADMAANGADYARNLREKTGKMGAETGENGAERRIIRTGAGYMVGSMLVMDDA